MDSNVALLSADQKTLSNEEEERREIRPGHIEEKNRRNGEGKKKGKDWGKKLSFLPVKSERCAKRPNQ